MTDDRRKIYIERIKNILIVALFLMTVLLLSFFWKDISLQDLSPIDLADEDRNAHIPAAGELIKPRSILFGFGSNTYTLKKADDPWEESTVSARAMELVRDYMANASSVEEIKQEQYQEVMSYSSINVRFDYAIPLEEFFENNGISYTVNLGSVEKMTSIAFSSASTENMLIRDNTKNTYYRVIVTDEGAAASLGDSVIRFIRSVEDSDFIPYYYISDIVGGENDALMPLYMSSSLAEMEGSQEFSISDQEKADRIASEFFASGLDFVRKITENKGTLLYMYGSSQSLILEEDGKLVYNENFNSSSYSQQGFYDSLTTAIEYISLYGGWDNLYLNGCRPYLKSADIVVHSGGSGYYFIFGLENGGKTVEYTEGNIVAVEVCGRQVTSYERDIIIISEEQADSEEQVMWEAMEPVNILTENYTKVCHILGIKTFEEMTARVENIRFCYVRDKQNDSLKIKPAWLMTMTDGYKFWFDPQTGELLGYRSAEVN